MSLSASLTTNNSALKREVDELRFKLKKVGESEGAPETDGRGMTELAQCLAEVEHERDELQEEFEGVREELVTLRREKSSLAQQVGDLTNSVQQLNEKIFSLEAQGGAVTPDVEQLVRVEHTLPLGKESRVGDSQRQRKDSERQGESLETELEELRQELSLAVNENHELKNEVNGLNWKLEEVTGLEQEVEELQTELSSSVMEKKILAHDLEEVRGEMSALQTDKHLLMKEVERLSEMMEGQGQQAKGSGDAKVSSSSSEELNQLLSTKDAEIIELQRALDEKGNELVAAVKELEMKTLMISEKEQLLMEMDGTIAEKVKELLENGKELTALKEKIGHLDGKVKGMSDLEQRVYSLTDDLEIARLENHTLRKKQESFNLKIDTVKSLESDFDSLNTDFNKVLEEKSEMARQIEELHIRIRELMSREQEVTFSVEQQQHVMREKVVLQRRVAELENTEGTSMEEGARLRQEMDKISAALQQAEFEKESLTSQLQLAKVGGASGSKFHEEYKKLQAQFTEVLEQKNSVVAQLNEAQHSLKQREARCQQMSTQVSQLAEDRGYLNTQLANLSKALREKEQEWLAMRQQYGDLYQAYIGSQSKNAELERRIALDSVQKELDEEETAAEADQTRGQSDMTSQRLEELESAYQTLREAHSALNTTLERERVLREQLEKELGQAHEQIQVLGAGREIHLQIGDDDDDDDETRIRETTTMLTRHGNGYCQRLNRWIRVKNRQLSRVMRLRPGLRTMIWIYFTFLHILLVACFTGIL